MVERFKETCHPVIKSISASSRVILKRTTETPHTSMRMLRTQNSYFERFTLQISSVSKEQSQAGREEFGQRPNEKEPTSEQFVEKENEQLLKSLKPQEVNSLVQTPRAMIQHLETDCENIVNTSEHWRKASTSQKFAKIRHSGKESLLECATRTVQTEQYAESIHTLVLIHIPEFMPQSQDEQELNQFFKFI